MNIYEMLKNLINNKYYKNKDEIIEKLNVFYSYNVLDTEQYQELMELTNKIYDSEEN